jgi:hypothetical protein
MSNGLDYAWGKPPYDELKHQGFKFAMRYVSHDPGKDLTLAEKNELWKRGISVGLVFESTSGRARAGSRAGIQDAQHAQASAVHLGLPTIPIYFAVDFDATDVDKPFIASYLGGATKVLGHDRVGVYGGYYVIKYMADQRVCKYFWQTYAWSGGRVHPAAHILQYKNGVRIGGLSCDLDRGLKPEIGVQGLQLAPKPPKPPVPPKPLPKPKKKSGLWRNTVYDVSIKLIWDPLKHRFILKKR